MSEPTRAAAVRFYREILDLALAADPTSVDALLGDLYDEGGQAGAERGRRETNVQLGKKLEVAREDLVIAMRLSERQRRRIVELEAWLRSLRLHREAVEGLPPGTLTGETSA